MIITMTHPQHGTHFAYDETEAAACASNGWERVVEAPPAPPAPEPVAEPIPEPAPEPVAVKPARSRLTLNKIVDDL